MNQLNVYSQKAVSSTATMKVVTLRKIIGMLNKLSGQEYRKGIIDPRTRARLSKAFSDLNRWRAIRHWVENNLYVYAHRGLSFLDKMLGNQAVRLGACAKEEDAVETSKKIHAAIWGVA